MKRVLLTILGVIVLAVAGGAFYLTRMDADFIVRRIAEATEKATGAPLELRDTPHLSLLPPGIRFGTAHWQGEIDGNAVAVSVEGGMARLELSPLFSGQLVISEIRLDRPEAEVRLAAARAAGVPPAQPGAERAPRERKAPDDTLPFELARLTVSQGALSLTDAESSTRISGFNLTLENLRRREEAAIQGDMVLALAGTSKDTATLLEGNLAFKGSLRYYAPNLTFRQVSLAFTPLAGLIPRELAPLQLTLEGALDLASLRLAVAEARLASPQGRVTLKGEGGLTPPAFKGDVTFTGSARKLAALGGVSLASGAPDTLDMRATLDWAGKKGVLDANLQLSGAGETGPQARLTFRGNANLEPVTVAGDVALTGAAHRLAQLAGLTLPKGAPDTVDVHSRVAFAGDALRLGGLDARAAGLSLSGDLTLGLPRAGGTPLSLAGKLRLGAIDLDPWLAAGKAPGAANSAAPAAQAPQGANAGAAQSGPAPSGQNAAMPALDLALSIAELRSGALGLTGMAGHIKGQGGHYTLDGFSARLRSGGTLRGSLTADLPASAWSVNANGTGIDVGALCAAAGKAGLASGSAGFTARLKARGAAAPALVASLDGDGVLEARDLSSQALREAAEKLRKLPVKLTIPDRVSTLNAPFSVRRGEITVRPLKAAAQGLSLQGEARASLAREYLEGSATVAVAGFNVPLDFKGPFDDVAVTVDPRFALEVGKKVLPQLLNKGTQTPAGERRGADAVREGIGKAGGIVRGLLGR